MSSDGYDLTDGVLTWPEHMESLVLLASANTQVIVGNYPPDRFCKKLYIL